MSEEFDKYGLELVDFFINAITPPDEVQKAIDARSAMGAVGDLNAFLRYQAANSLTEDGRDRGRLRRERWAWAWARDLGMMLPGMLQQAMTAGPGASSPVVPVPQAPPAQTASGPLAAGWSGQDLSQLHPVSLDPRQIVRSVATSAGYTVQESGDTWEVVVPLGTLRKQKVMVEFGKPDDSGHALVSYWSVCGPASEKNASILLRFNADTVHGSFAVRNLSGQRNRRAPGKTARRYAQSARSQPRPVGGRMASRPGRTEVDG